MSLSKMNNNLNIIQSLPDVPTLSAEELKEKFDEGINSIKTYLNQILTVEIDSLISSLQTSVNNKVNKSGGTVSGTLTLDGGLRINSTGTVDGIELYGSTPYMDFHYGNSSGDYTSRIIENANHKLEIDAVNGVNFLTTKDRVSINGYSIDRLLVSAGSTDNYIVMTWQTNKMALSVDNSLQGYITLTSTSDRRLKDDIKSIDENILKAVGEVEIKQFKVNRNNPDKEISFGVIAQELIASFEKYNLNVADYNIIDTIVYEDGIEYYIVNYEQFNILRNAYRELKQKELEERIAKLENS